MLRGIGATFSFLFAWSVWAQSTPPDFGDFTQFSLIFDDQYNYSAVKLLGEDPLTASSFERDLSRYSDYDSFLTYLQGRAPELFWRPVLLHSSGSLQLTPATNLSSGVCKSCPPPGSRGHRRLGPSARAIALWGWPPSLVA
ncbi:MAG: hypothetical protein AB7N80_03700 [Bdellovibrionales bacterium]